MDELISELKTRRETMGLSLQDMFRKTRINIAFLEALEDGNFDILPEAYVKLFLKRYAQEVKLDGDEIVRRFEKLHWKTKAETQPPPQRSQDGLPGWVIGVGAAVVLAAGVGLFVVLSEPEKEDPRPSFASSAVASRTTPPSNRPAMSEAPSSAPRPAADVDVPTADASPVTDSAGLQETITVEVSDPALQDAADGTTPSLEAAETSTDAPQEAEEEAPEVIPPAIETVETAEPTETVETTEPPQPTVLSPVESAERPEPETVEPETEVAAERVVSAYSLSLRTDLSATPGPLRLIATGLEGTQVTVTSDGEPVFNDRVDAGRRVSWEARDRFSIEIQNGAGVSLRLQDEDLPPFATAGRQVRLYVSRSSIWIEEVEPSNPPVGDTGSP